MRRWVFVGVFLLVVGCCAYRLFRSSNEDGGERAASIVVVTDPDVSVADEHAIGGTLQHMAGVSDVLYVRGSTILNREGLTGQRPYLELFDGLPPDSYELTTRDQASHETLENGSFRADVLAMPGVDKVYFGCADMVACALRDKASPSATHP